MRNLLNSLLEAFTRPPNLLGHTGFGRSQRGGGKGGADAPDYTPVANASAHAADLGKQLGDAQLAEAKRQYEINRSIAEPVVAAQLGLMNQTNSQGADYYD